MPSIVVHIVLLNIQFHSALGMVQVAKTQHDKQYS